MYSPHPIRAQEFRDRVLNRGRPPISDLIPAELYPRIPISNRIEHARRLVRYKGLANDFIQNISAYPAGRFQGRGIVTAAGGAAYYTCAYVMIRMLRKLGCSLPVELWHLGPYELDDRMRAIMESGELGDVRCVDAYQVRKEHPCRILNGWELNPYSMLHSRFKEVLFLDADNVPVVNPEFLFKTKEYADTGAIFWPDYKNMDLGPSHPIWAATGAKPHGGRSFESGQMLVDKERGWLPLNLAMHYNENSDYYYRIIHGDKDTYHMAWTRLAVPYTHIPHEIEQLPAKPSHSLVMCQHDMNGQRIFQHRNQDKWRLDGANKLIGGFLFEEFCLECLADLRKVWDGKIANKPTKAEKDAADGFVGRDLGWWGTIDGRPFRVTPESTYTFKDPNKVLGTNWWIEDTGDGLELVTRGPVRLIARFKKHRGNWVGYRLHDGALVLLR